MKRIALSIVVLVLLAASLPVFAQENDLTAEEQDAIAIVADAISGLEELDSYSMYSEQTIVQDMEMTAQGQSATITNDISQVLDFQVAKSDNGYDVMGSLEQNTVTDSGGQTLELSLTFDVVAVGGETYIRVGGDAGPLSSMLPEGWVQLGDPSLAGNPILSSFTPETIQQFYDQTIPIDEESIISIEEQAGAEIDGQAVRVFDVQYDPNALVESGIFDSMVSGMASPGMTPEDTQSMLQTMFEGADITYTAYVGEDDGLLYQIDSVITVDSEITVQGLTLPLVMTVDSITTFSGFNEPVTIEAPELGS